MEMSEVVNGSRGVALVTGGGGGLGAALAEGLAVLGYDVGVHYFRNVEGAEEVVRKVGELGRRAVCFQGDLGCGDSVRGVAEAFSREFGSLDVLVNNAGVYHSRGLLELSEEEWFEGISSTATAVFLATRAFLPFLRESECGRVVNVGDSSCERVGARNLAMSYHIGKTGVLMLTKSFAQELAGDGVTVNMVSPGFLSNSQDLPEAGVIPMGRFGEFSDVMGAVEYLVSEKASYVTGTNVVLSGGWNLR